jgi:hypothetical protein
MLKEAIIRHEGDKWVVRTHDGSRILGTHDTREDAEKQLYAIEINKKHKKSFKNAGVEHLNAALQSLPPGWRAVRPGVTAGYFGSYKKDMDDEPGVLLLHNSGTNNLCSLPDPMTLSQEELSNPDQVWSLHQHGPAIRSMLGHLDQLGTGMHLRMTRRAVARVQSGSSRTLAMFRPSDPTSFYMSGPSRTELLNLNHSQLAESWDYHQHSDPEQGFLEHLYGIPSLLDSITHERIHQLTVPAIQDRSLAKRLAPILSMASEHFSSEPQKEEADRSLHNKLVWSPYDVLKGISNSSYRSFRDLVRPYSEREIEMDLRLNHNVYSSGLSYDKTLRALQPLARDRVKILSKHPALMSMIMSGPAGHGTSNFYEWFGHLGQHVLNPCTTTIRPHETALRREFGF